MWVLGSEGHEREIRLLMPKNEPIAEPLQEVHLGPAEILVPEPPTPIEPAMVSIAPVWHTLVLIIGILGLSIAGSTGLTSQRHGSNRLITYGATAGMEILMLGWVALGLWLRKVPFKSLFGSLDKGVRGLFLDAVIGFAFWIGAMTILGSIGLAWTAGEYAATHHNTLPRPGQHIDASPAQKQTAQTLAQLAPSNGKEIACWVLLCCIAGFVEEAVFRGYLQRQFTAWARGGAVVGVVISASMFGAAHGYQGMRNMVMLAVFGALFSLLALFRKSLRAGIFAHSGHDLIAGLALMYLRAHHVI